jgi:hypothetical protein
MKTQISILLFTSLLFSTASAQKWTSTTPANLGNANGLAVHNGAIFVTTAAQGPHRSTDGSNWVQKKDGLTGAGPQGAQITDLGTWLYYGSKSGIHRSDDDGTTWKSAGNGITVGATNFAKWFYKINNTYFCVMSGNISAGGGIFRSDNGVDWTQSTTGMATNNTVYQMAEIDGKLYAGTNLDFFESDDHGLNWTSVKPRSSMLHNGITDVKGRRLLFTTFGILYSDDDGMNWKESTDDPKGTTNCGFIEGENDTLYAWAAFGGVYYSLDTGSSWVDISGDLTTNDIMFMQEVVLFNKSLYLATLLTVKTNRQGSPVSVDPMAKNRLSANLYPNPFSDAVYLDLNLPSGAKIELINVLGQTILLHESTQPTSVVNLSTQEVPKGHYYLRIRDLSTGQALMSKAIFKQ